MKASHQLALVVALVLNVVVLSFVSWPGGFYRATILSSRMRPAVTSLSTRTASPREATMSVSGSNSGDRSDPVIAIITDIQELKLKIAAVELKIAAIELKISAVEVEVAGVKHLLLGGNISTATSNIHDSVSLYERVDEPTLLTTMADLHQKGTALQQQKTALLQIQAAASSRGNLRPTRGFPYSLF